ncbi:Reverse transcriptase domain-containing protein, partial [Aphis craccivora]
MRKGVVMSAHDYGGHFSVDRTIARITKDYWFSYMKRYVRQHIEMCIDCGDFNAKHQSWGCRVNNPRGVTLYNFTNLKRFKVQAPPDPTYWPSSS